MADITEFGQPLGLEKVHPSEREASQLVHWLRGKVTRYGELTKEAGQLKKTGGSSERLIRGKNNKLYNTGGEEISSSQWKHVKRILGSTWQTETSFFAPIAQKLSDINATDKQALSKNRVILENLLEAGKVTPNDQMHHLVASNIFRWAHSQIPENVRLGGQALVKKVYGIEFGDQKLGPSFAQRSHIGTPDPLDRELLQIPKYSGKIVTPDTAIGAHPAALGGTTGKYLEAQVRRAMTRNGKLYIPKTDLEYLNMYKHIYKQLIDANTLGELVDETRRGVIREYAINNNAKLGLAENYDPFSLDNTPEQKKTFKKAIGREKGVLTKAAMEWHIPENAKKFAKQLGWTSGAIAVGSIINAPSSFAAGTGIKALQEGDIDTAKSQIKPFVEGAVNDLKWQAGFMLASGVLAKQASGKALAAKFSSGLAPPVAGALLLKTGYDVTNAFIEGYSGNTIEGHVGKYIGEGRHKGRTYTDKSGENAWYANPDLSIEALNEQLKTKKYQTSITSN